MILPRVLVAGDAERRPRVLVPLPRALLTRRRMERRVRSTVPEVALAACRLS